MDITIKKIKAQKTRKGKLIFEYDQKEEGSPVRLAAMGQSGTDIRQIAG